MAQHGTLACKHASGEGLRVTPTGAVIKNSNSPRVQPPNRLQCERSHIVNSAHIRSLWGDGSLHGPNLLASAVRTQRAPFEQPLKEARDQEKQTHSDLRPPGTERALERDEGLNGAADEHTE